jgi:hypothetical protein
MQHWEPTSGASRAARGSTGTLAAHGAGEERAVAGEGIPTEEEAASTHYAAPDKGACTLLMQYMSPRIQYHRLNILIARL